MDPRLDLRKIYYLILVMLNISVLICLAKGDNGTGYLNYYPTNHTLLRGEYISGSLPSSIQNVDSDYLIFKSVASDTSFPINPSWYTLGGSTSLISGNLTDLTSSNDVCMAFRSYYSGINTVDFIDSASSDVDFSVDKGTHSIFSAQQAGPDSISDTLTEADNNPSDNNNVDSEIITDGSTTGISGAQTVDGFTENITEGTIVGDAPVLANYEVNEADAVTSISVNKPSGTSSGDLLIILLGVDGTIPQPSTPTGFTYVTTWYVDNSHIQCSWYREADGTEGASFSSNWFSGNAEDAVMACLRITGWDNGDFPHKIATNDGISGDPVFPATTTEKDNCLLLRWYGMDDDDDSEPIGGVPSGHDVIFARETNTFFDGEATTLVACNRTRTTAGDIGTATWNQAATMEGWNTVTLAIAPEIVGYQLDVEHVVNSIANYENYNLTIRAYRSAENFYLQLYNFSSSQWVNMSIITASSLTWYNTTVAKADFINSTDHARIRYWQGIDTAQENLHVDYSGIYGWNMSNYELDLEVHWTSVDFDEAYEELCIYTGSTDAEDIEVDVWNTTTSNWDSVFADLTANSWNNVSVSSYLESPTITIRFKGSEETADTIQDSWKIDVTLLHVWSDEQATEVEFKGSSNPQNWSNLNWTTSIGWTTGSVNVIIQLYNFSLGDYSPYRSGYLSYNSSFTAQEDDTKSQTILHNPSHFRNSTGHWKMRIKGVKLTKIQFDMKIDWLQIKPSDVYTLLTEFTFSNMTSNTATLLNFSLVSRYSENVENITLQVWNYSNSAYTTDLETCLRYTPNRQNESKTLSITENPQFYVSNITSKIRISVESTGQFQQKIDQIILRYGYSMKSSLDQLFSWPGILLFTLPLMASLLFIPILLFKRKKKPKNIFEDKVYPFSKSFGMSHQQISGKKILLEVNPTSDFQEALFSFVSEARIHDEKLLIFTSKNSPLYLKFSGVKNIKFYLLASKTSSPPQRNAKETLLPANDPSVILNTIAKIHGTKRRKPVKVLFDNLSDTILLCGFEKTYKFIRWLLETITSPKMTILFVFNPTAHDPKTSSSVRGLFSTQLAYGKNGPEIVTL